METRHQGFTVMMLGADYCRTFPTTIQEHERILHIYKQDRRYRDVINDFTEFGIGGDTSPTD